MNAAIKTIGITAAGILLGYILVRIAERIEESWKANQARKAQAATPPATPAADPVGAAD